MDSVKEYYLLENSGNKYLVVIESTKEESKLSFLKNGIEVDSKTITGFGTAELSHEGTIIDASISAYSIKLNLNVNGEKFEMSKISASQINSNNASTQVKEAANEEGSSLSNSKWRIILLGGIILGALLNYFFRENSIMNILTNILTGGSAYLLAGTFFPAFMNTGIGSWVKIIAAFATIFLADSIIDRISHGGSTSSELLAKVNESSPSVLTTISKVEQKTKYRRRRPDIEYFLHSYQYSVNGKSYDGNFKGSQALLSIGDTINILYLQEDPSIHKVQGLTSEDE